MEIVVPLSNKVTLTPEQVRINSYATTHVSLVMHEVPSALASVFHALGTMQRNIGPSFVVYAKGGLCLVLAAKAVATCLGDCKQSKNIHKFILEQITSGVLSPSDVDTTIMTRCPISNGEPDMLMGVKTQDETILTREAKNTIQGLNKHLYDNKDFWKKLESILCKTTDPSIEISSESMDIDISTCDENGVVGEEITFAKIVSTESKKPPLMRSLNSTLKVVAGFTLVRSKLHMYEEEFLECENTIDQSIGDEKEVWFDAVEKQSDPVAEILDISWKDGEHYGCDMFISDLMPLKVNDMKNQQLGIFMMTIPALVKDLLFCLMSTPEQKSTKRILRMALACSIANDDLSNTVREYLSSSNKSNIPDEFNTIFNFNLDINNQKRKLFISMIHGLSTEITTYIQQGTYIKQCMNDANNDRCLSEGLIIDFSNNNFSVSPINIGLSKGGDMGNNIKWSWVASAAAGIAVTLASSFVGALRR